MAETYMDLAESLVKRLEGCKLVGYLDSVGKVTNGYGNRRGARLGVEITQEIANHDLAVNLDEADRELMKCCNVSALTEMHKHQRAALVSFVFNVGADPTWHIWQAVNDGGDVPAQLRRFDHGRINGVEQVIPGLEHRREAEIIFWNTGDEDVAVSVTQTDNAVEQPPSSFTREVVTAPAPAAAPPLAKTSLAVKVGTGIAGIGAAASQIHGIVAPHVAESAIFQHAAVACSGVIIIAASVGVLIHANQSQARAR